MNIQLGAIDGTEFDLSALRGRPFLLSFYRFASCPFCNLRVHEMTRRFHEFRDQLGIVAVFDAPLDHLRLQAARHRAPFPILADTKRRYYAEYGIESSALGVLRGMVLRFPRLLYAMFGLGFVPLRLRGRLTTMPADFLVDASGTIRVAHYGRDEGDHLPFADLLRFAAAAD